MMRVSDRLPADVLDFCHLRNLAEVFTCHSVLVSIILRFLKAGVKSRFLKPA